MRPHLFMNRSELRWGVDLGRSAEAVSDRCILSLKD